MRWRMCAARHWQSKRLFCRRSSDRNGGSEPRARNCPTANVRRRLQQTVETSRGLLLWRDMSIDAAAHQPPGHRPAVEWCVSASNSARSAA
eukprot:6424333-Prymnesium_polylepis.1